MLEPGSSPTSGTTFSLVRGDYALTCVQTCRRIVWRVGWRAVAWPPRWHIQVCGVAGSGPWLMGPPPASVGFLRYRLWILSGWSGRPAPIYGPACGVQHDFGDFRTKFLLKGAF